MKPGPLNVITDVAGLHVGSAQDEAAKTGVTVLIPKAPARAAVSVMGGGPGTRETDALRLDTLVDRVDAVVLAGGSVYGLAAADAVATLLGAAGRGFSLVAQEGVPVSPIVPAAILYDLSNGGDKNWGETPPYVGLGREAFASAQREFALGQAGAGYGALAGAHRGGLGSASIVTESGHTVGALVAVNAFGSPYLPGTNCFWAAPFEIGDEFGGRGFPERPRAAGLPSDSKLGAGARQNTTVGIIATDADLTAAELQRVAVMAQDGLARAIRPAHGPTDGDTIFALSTGAREAGPLRPMTVLEIGTAAGDVMARAIARGVYETEPDEW